MILHKTLRRKISTTTARIVWKMVTTFMVILVLNCCTIYVQSMTAMPLPFQELLPDGTSITLQIEGDECEHYERDLNGYTTLHDTKSGYRFYAQQNLYNGQLEVTKYRVGKIDPTTIPELSKGLRDDISSRDCTKRICRDDDDDDKKNQPKQSKRSRRSDDGTSKKKKKSHRHSDSFSSPKKTNKGRRRSSSSSGDDGSNSNSNSGSPKTKSDGHRNGNGDSNGAHPNGDRSKAKGKKGPTTDNLFANRLGRGKHSSRNDDHEDIYRDQQRQRRLRERYPLETSQDESDGASATNGTITTTVTPLSQKTPPRHQSRRTAQTTGLLRNLVIPIRWSDHVTRDLPTQGQLDILLNHHGPHPTYCPTGSLQDFFTENSYGQLLLESVVHDWVTVPYTEREASGGYSGLGVSILGPLRAALRLVDIDTDFTQFDLDQDGQIDAITFLHSGYAAEWGGSDSYGTPRTERIWSHKWKYINYQSVDGSPHRGVRVNQYHISPALWGKSSGDGIGRIGVIAHETGHFLGLPDLYDTDPYNSIGRGNGIGSWGVMANAWGFNNDQLYPPHFCAWSKIKMGWLVPKPVEYGINYVTAMAELPGSAKHDRVIKIGDGEHGFPKKEYLLIENRQPIGFDGAIPQGGLLIFHIDDSLSDYNTQGYPGQDDSTWPENGKHYRVAVLQADGLYHLERNLNRGDGGDVFRGCGGGANYLGPSSSTSDSMTFFDHSGPFPNTDAYQNGTVYQTTNEIMSISAAATDMWFTFTDGWNRASSAEPSLSPSSSPPSYWPSRSPSYLPSSIPSKVTPSNLPSLTMLPSMDLPASQPSSMKPSVQSTATDPPSVLVLQSSSSVPSLLPSTRPSGLPSLSNIPSIELSISSALPSDIPSLNPSLPPSDSPSLSIEPSLATALPSDLPSLLPSMDLPSLNPSLPPSDSPSLSIEPSISTALPSDLPSFLPSMDPPLPHSTAPSDRPSLSRKPSTNPSSIPFMETSWQPTVSNLY